MPYARQYELSEIKGMLMIAEDSANIKVFQDFKKKKKNATFAAAPAAHAAGLHSAQTADALATRVDTGPQKASTFKDFDTLALATTAGLNHANGQIALQALDAGNMSATFTAPLAGNLYYGSRSTRVGAKKSGVVNNEPFMVATEIFVKVNQFIAGKLWIQTSYPNQLNARAEPSLAALP